MPGSVEECVVITLKGTPAVQISRKSTNSARHVGDTSDVQKGRIPAGEGPKRSIGRCLVNGTHALIVVYGFVVVPEPDGVDKGRGETVGFLSRNDLSRA